MEISYQEENYTFSDVKVNLLVPSRLGEFIHLFPNEKINPDFGIVWPAALALSEELSNRNLSGLRLIEIGAGIALPALVSAKKGAHVSVLDCYSAVEDCLKKNQVKNDVSIQYLHHDWRYPLNSGEKFDWIIASDILYEGYEPEKVPRFIQSLCHRESRILLTDPGRDYLGAFIDEMRNSGFSANEKVETVTGLKTGPETQEIWVIELSI